MSDLSGKFTTLETQLSNENAALLTALGEVSSSLGLVNSNLELLIENGAANTKYILAALGQSAACFPCPTPSIVVPPYASLPVGVDTERCKRAQGLIAALEAILGAMDTMQSFNVVGTFSVVNDAISEVISGIVTGGGPPLPSFPECVNIVGDYISYAGERLFSGVGLMEQFGPIADDLRNAIYGGGSPEGAKAAYDAAIDSSDVSAAAKLLFKAIGYSSLFNYYLDPDSEPDVSGYDGAVCSGATHDITTCTDFAAIAMSIGGYSYYYVPGVPSCGPNALYFAGDYYGWSFQLVAGVAGRGVDVYRTTDFVDGPFTQGHSFPSEAPQVMSQHSVGIAIVTHDTNELAFPFTMRICPPA